MKRAALACLTVLLAACATPQPRTETVEVKIPVPVACLPAEQPGRPAIATNEQLLALSDYDLVLELAAERGELIAYIGQLETLVKGCRLP